MSFRSVFIAVVDTAGKAVDADWQLAKTLLERKNLLQTAGSKSLPLSLHVFHSPWLFGWRAGIHVLRDARDLSIFQQGQIVGTRGVQARGRERRDQSIRSCGRSPALRPFMSHEMLDCKNQSRLEVGSSCH